LRSPRRIENGGSLLALFAQLFDITPSGREIVSSGSSSRGINTIPIDTLILASEEIKKRPGLRDSSDSLASTLYHHVLQRAIVGWLQLKYPATWECCRGPCLSPFFILDADTLSSCFETSRFWKSDLALPKRLGRTLQSLKICNLDDGSFGSQTERNGRIA
jgi:hypothetical protein